MIQQIYLVRFQGALYRQFSELSNPNDNKFWEDICAKHRRSQNASDFRYVASFWNHSDSKTTGV